MHPTKVVEKRGVSFTPASCHCNGVNALRSPLYGFPVRRLSGAKCTLAAYAGAVLLIVNLASPDILTRPYGDLEQLHRIYSDREFAVLGFPSDDFNNQQTGPSDNKGVYSTSNDDVRFPMFDKIVTKGVNQHLLYRYLTAMQPVAVSRPGSQLLAHLLRNGLLLNAPADGELLWNFEKFLISRSGKVVARFGPDVTVEQNVILKAIERQLKSPRRPGRRWPPVGRLWAPALRPSAC
jgi:glutathione peroxidase